jgi:hypothetical protein
VVSSPAELIASFVSGLGKAGFTLPKHPIKHQLVVPPHKELRLEPGMAAVYAFTLTADHGANCSAGPNRAIKVGLVGPNSLARFASQHYLPMSSGSNLARSLLDGRLLWPYLGIDNLDQSTVGSWIRTHTDRDHFFLSAQDRNLRLSLERYVRATLGSIFEGWASTKAATAD